MGSIQLDVPWTLIEPEDPSGSDMVDVSGVTRKWLDVPYAPDSPSQVLDIYLPEEGEGPFPTYIFLHGGAFIVGDKRDVQFLLAAEGVNRGYAVVSVEYRRALESKAPNALYDVKSAVRFLRAHAAEYRLDPDRAALMGYSAGGHIAAGAAILLRDRGVKMTARERQAEIDRLEKEMRKAAQMLEYEYAAVLRDQLIKLRGEK